MSLQDDLQTKYTGGTVLHIFLGEQIGDTRALRSLVRKISTNYHLPYFTLTPTFSICPTHGYLAGEHHTCVTCSLETEVRTGKIPYRRPLRRKPAPTSPAEKKGASADTERWQKLAN